MHLINNNAMTLEEFYQKNWINQASPNKTERTKKLESLLWEQLKVATEAKRIEWLKTAEPINTLSFNESPYWNTSRFRNTIFEPKYSPVVSRQQIDTNLEQPIKEQKQDVLSLIKDPTKWRAVWDFLYTQWRELAQEIYQPSWQKEQMSWWWWALQKTEKVLSTPIRFLASVVPSFIADVSWAVTAAWRSFSKDKAERDKALDYLTADITEKSALFGKIKSEKDIEDIYNVIRDSDAYIKAWYSEKDAKLMRWTLLLSLWWAKAWEIAANFIWFKAKPWTKLTRTMAGSMSDMDFASRRLLNVSDNATSEQINNAARPYLRKYSPDNLDTWNANKFKQYWAARDYLINKNKETAKAKFIKETYQDPFDVLWLDKNTATEKDVQEAVYDLLDIFRWNREEIDNIYRARQIALDDIKWTRRSNAIQKIETAAAWQQSWDVIVTPRRIAWLVEWRQQVPVLATWLSSRPYITPQVTPQVEFQIPNLAAQDTSKKISEDINTALQKRASLAESAWDNKAQIDRLTNKINELRTKLESVDKASISYTWPVSTRTIKDRTYVPEKMVSYSPIETQLMWTVTESKSWASVIKIWEWKQKVTVSNPITINVPSSQFWLDSFEEPFKVIAEYKWNDAVIFKSSDWKERALIVEKNYKWPKIIPIKENESRSISVKKEQVVKVEKPKREEIVSVKQPKVSVVEKPKEVDILSWPIKTIKDFDSTYEYGKYLEQRERAMSASQAKDVPVKKEKAKWVDVKSEVTEKTIKEMVKAWMVEDDFNNLYEMLVKEWRYDEASIVIDHMVGNFDDASVENWPLYSKATESIDSYESRAYASTRKKIEKLHQLSYDLVHKYAKDVERRTIPKRLRGLYRPDSDSVWVKSLTDVSLVAHELAHAIDIKSGIIEWILKDKDYPLITALKQVYIATNNGKLDSEVLMLREGLATFIQKMIESPIKTTSEYPELALLLKQEAWRFKEIQEMMRWANEIISYYQSLSDIDKSIAKSGTITVKEWKHWMPPVERYIRFTSDYVRPMEYLARLQNKHRTNSDPAVWFRAKKVMANLFATNFTKEWPWRTLDANWNIVERYKYNWATLLNKLKKYDWDEYDAYRVNRRYFFIDKKIKELQAKPDLSDTEKEELKNMVWQLVNSRVDIEQVKKIYLDNKDKYKSVDRMFDSLLRENIRMWMRFGVIGKEYWKELLKKEWYSPFLKVIVDDSIKESRWLFNNKWWIPFWYKKFKGSDDPILSPVLWFFRLAYETNKKMILQQSLNKMYWLASKSNWAVKIISSEKSKYWMIIPRVEWNTATFMRNGKMITIQMNRDLSNVFKTDAEISVQNSQWFDRNMSKFMWTVTNLITWWWFPAFAVTNLLIDSPAAMAQARSSLLPIKDWLVWLLKAKVLWDETAQKRLKLWIDMWWIDQTIMSIYKDNPEDFINIMKQEHEWFKKTAIDIKNKWFGALKQVITYSEIVNRFGEFSAWLDKWRSVLEAYWDATRSSAPFAHIWEFGWALWRTWLKSILYGRSSFHVAAQYVDTMYYNETRWKWLTVSAGMAIASAVWMIWAYYSIEKSDLPEDEKNLLRRKISNLSLYDISNNFISMVPWQEPRIKKIRVPNNYAIAWTIVSMLMANAIFDAWHWPKEFVKITADWLLPEQMNIVEPLKAVSSFVPYIIQWPLSVYANYKTFPEIKELEPEYMKHLPTEDRYTPYTNDLAIVLWQTQVAKELKLSPMQIEFLMWWAWWRATTNYTKYINESWWLFKWFTETFPWVKKSEYIFTWREVDKFYELKEKAYADYKRLAESYDIEARIESRNTNKLYSDVWEMISWLKEIHRDKWTVTTAYHNMVMEIVHLLNKWDIEKAQAEYYKLWPQLLSEIKVYRLEKKIQKKESK